MVELDVCYTSSFKKDVSKLKDSLLKQKVKKQIERIVENPEIGKPMRNLLKGTREVYISPYRLAYAYKKNELVLLFLSLYHKDKQKKKRY